jgi:membrane protease subunit HflC
MRNAFGLVLVGIAVFVLVILGSATFEVLQTQQALVLRFGEPVAGRGLITEPGLHFKIPFVESVVLLDNRILDLESPKQEVLASDNQRIEVDAFVRYRIVDALRFYQTVGTIERANNQLASVLNSAVRRVLGEANQTQIVRDDRANLMVRIREQVNAEGARFGVRTIDARIRRADLPREISEKVYGRMQTERAREAAEYRAQGSEQAQKINAKADRDVVVLRASAQQQADQVRGQGDAERNRIFAEAYGQDPDFFAFYRSMQAYDASFKARDTRFVTSPTSDFFRYFGSAAGKGTPPAPGGAPASGGASAQR